LTTLFGTVEPAEVQLIEAESRKKHGWLPILTVLFLISYALMTMLIVEQGQTIESQRALIRELFRDSKDPSASRLKAQGQENAQGARAAAPHKIAPQLPSTQAPARKSPSSRAGSQFAAQDRAAQQKSFRSPSKPESDLTDSSRALITI
jgi:hypothetical protein